MILSNRGIQKALDEGRLVIEPEPLPREPVVGGPACPYDTTAVDLRLGRYISVPRTNEPFTFDPRKPGTAKFMSDHSDEIDLTRPGGFTLDPNIFVLGVTLEKVGLPLFETRPPLAARIEGKSSRARMGLLVHFTAPTVHAGWSGPLALEMIVLGPASITLWYEQPICQLIIEECESVPFANPSQFQDQKKPAGTR
ncbi:MAG TPA: dCTP deaminase [Methylomirabilota bacterium]|jgi:dCTP deaminase|nr:dCTP deaminase [Methylomirabilota bacterium]